MTRLVMKWLGRTVAFVLVLCVIVAGLVYAASERKLRKKWDTSVDTVALPTDSASIARGEHLVRNVTNCTLCHGDDLGGAIYSSSPAIGTVAGPNLTRGRGGRAYEPLDYVRAIRRGVKRDSTSLIVMPSEVFTHLTQQDLAAVVAFLMNAKPVDREVPKSGFGPLGRAFLATGKMNILVAGKTPHLTPVESVPIGATAAYGKYIADISGCHGCHGYALSGGRVAGPPGLPPASNLTPAGIGTWTEADLARALREGKRPDGTALNEFMPWKVFRGMTDAEVHAIWLYLRSVPAKESGNK